MANDNACHASSTLEKVLEHRFIAELSTELWLRGVSDLEVLRSEVDSHGYDIVVEAEGLTRHIQLKGLRRGGKRSKVTVSTRLAEKPSGCVVWMVYDPATLVLGPFLWFGGRPGTALPSLGHKIAHHTKWNGSRVRTERVRQRVIKKGAFTRIDSIAALADALFGQAPLTNAAFSNGATHALAG